MGRQIIIGYRRLSEECLDILHLVLPSPCSVFSQAFRRQITAATACCFESGVEFMLFLHCLFQTIVNFRL